MLVELVDEGLNAAVIPCGTPAIVRATAFARFNGFTIVMVLATVAPLTCIDRLLLEDDNVKLGAGTVSRMFTEEVVEPDLPFAVTV